MFPPKKVPRANSTDADTAYCILHPEVINVRINILVHSRRETIKQ
ncbi:MAG: hypothetical protein UIT70_01845 [Clostridia bacterium]|nr:hypothetical protein [Clostridia bacterium]